MCVAIYLYTFACMCDCDSHTVSKYEHPLSKCLLQSFSKMFKQLMDEKNAGSKLVGSWTVEVGDQDEAGEVVAVVGFPVAVLALM